MKSILFLILIFALPHVEWFPRKFQLRPEEIPLGMLNWTLFIGFILWISGKVSGIQRSNTIKLYTIFVILTCLSIILSLIYQFEDLTVTFTLFKNQTLLLLLFYVPLSSIKDEKEFKKVFYLMLLVHVVIGIEVLRSGMLGGINFNDSKRGSGPFAEDFWGSDIAGAYLAQIAMFFFAIILTTSMKLPHRSAALVASAIILLGIYATYARGALFGCAAGLTVMLGFLGFQKKYLLIVAIMLSVAYLTMPASIGSRMDNTISVSGTFDESTLGRFFYWEQAAEILAKHPLGVGVGQMRAAMESRIGRHVDPHNSFLYTACEYGIIGVLVFMAMLVSVLLQAKKIWSNKSLPDVYRVYALGTGGLVGSFIACNMFYANFYKELIMGTITIHLGMLAFITAEANSRREIEKP